MKLIEFEQSHLTEIMQWFPSQDSIAIWGGPHFRFPYSEQSFLEDLNLADTEAFIIGNEAGAAVAFGQYYLRCGRCHLGRLVVSPLARGGGIGKKLIAQLCQRGRDQLNTKECSLFVMAHNKSAMDLYLSLGFQVSSYPEDIPADMFYMVLPGAGCQ